MLSPSAFILVVANFFEFSAERFAGDILVLRRALLPGAVCILGFLTACGRFGYQSHEEDASRPDMLLPSDAISADDAEVDAGADASVDLGVPAIVVAPTEGLRTSETGASDTFTVVLTTPPTSIVVVSLTSSDPSEGTPSPSAVAFTASNWNAAQTVTVTGINDSLPDGPVDYEIETAPAASSDPAYADMDADDVAVRNLDDETADVFVTPTTGLATGEDGTSDSFSVVLTRTPTADVTISLESSAPSEALVAPSSITFTTANWASPQDVTVTGVDDDVADGNASFTVTTSSVSSADVDYNGLDVDDVIGTNEDDETVGINVTPVSGLSTTEGGGNATFAISLQSRPGGPVQVPIASNDITEGNVGVAMVSFTTSNWNVAQMVTVTGIDDLVADGDQAYSVAIGPATSTDASYDTVVGPSVSLLNVDNETAGIDVDPLAGLTTSEAGGTAMISVTLRSEPTADVVLSATSTDLTEGVIAPASLTFTAGNWNVPQSFVVTGANDSILDGDIPYQAVVHVMSSSDTIYGALSDVHVSLTNIDDDTAGVTVSPTTGLVTTEGGGTATFSVVLNSQPADDVVFALSSDVLSEATVAPASVTFTNSNWSTPQIVTATGVDDFVVDGARVFHIVTGVTSSADPNFNGINPDDVAASNSDNDVVGVNVTPTSGLTTTESGGTATFTLALLSLPSADVSFSLVSGKPQEATVAPMSVTFTTANWSTPQTITLTGVDDLLDDGDISFAVGTSACVSADLTYDGFNPSDVNVTNLDNDTAAVTVTPTIGLTTTESGGTGTFTLVLTTQPGFDVTINLMSSNVAEGTVLPASVTFTNVNWSTPQTVTVTGVDDVPIDGSIAYSVVTSAGVSADLGYNGLAVADVSLINIDNEIPYLERVSVSTASAQANGDNYQSILSRDGRFVLFESLATSLVASSDTNGTWDVFLRDMVLSTTICVSVNSAGVLGNGQSHVGGFSPDNRYVAFYSDASNIVAGDTNGVTDLFLYDRNDATVSRVSLSTAGVQGNAASGSLVYFTDDGRYMIFGSFASNLVPGDTNGQFDTFMRDLQTNTTTRISFTSAGGELNGYAALGGISGDGRYFYFATNGTNAIPTDTNGVPDTFVRDLMTGTVVRASVDSAGMQGNADSYGGGNLSITQDGRYVVFMSQASNLVAGDTNGTWDIFVRDLLMNTTTRVNVSSGGAQAMGTTYNPLLSRDGSTVVFTSTASNLAATDTNGAWDIFARRLGTGITVALSVTAGPTTGNANSGQFGVVAVSDDGRFAAFHSYATDLVAGDTNGFRDIIRATIP